ncbi:hypothetical protein REC12_20295 [Desulfosporosinus sp. PR]|uniref:hypothetical protein n=1 Tax=Candidatus Desulfosporosinus nitrosoreducens TaxID=3401928 RepID=UPI0027FF84EC|nr:hypothetical protein [Desulfosporosinus sp. PR]MDQ7095938.1 hypothetical protein [Desulfosporosinus sp. PR]
MAEKSSFFNSVNGDRKYQASDFAEFFNSLVTNGIFPNPSTNLQVLANNDMTVTVKAGPAWIKGYHYLNDSDLVLTIDVADGVLNRIDRIALRMDTVGRAINAVVKKGTFASSPVAPALQRDADAYELGIADIYVGKGVISIVQANITDLRMNTTYCGWVNSLIQADTTAIFNQYQNWLNAKIAAYDTDFTNWTNAEKSDYDTWTADKKAAYDTWYAAATNAAEADVAAFEAQFQADFNAWFNTIQGQLSGDVAANLANQINSLAGTGRTTETVKANADAITNLAGTGRTTQTVKGNADAIAATNTAFATHQADYVRQPGYAPNTGAANHIVMTLSPAPTSYVDGMGVTIKPSNASTAATDINVNGLGVKNIVDSFGNPVTNFKANTIYSLKYEAISGNFIVQGNGGGSIAEDFEYGLNPVTGGLY